MQHGQLVLAGTHDGAIPPAAAKEVWYAHIASY